MSVSDIRTHPNGLPRGLTDERALQLIRELVAMGGRVVFVPHCLERMQLRDVSTEQVMVVLKRGEITRSVRWNNDNQNYELTLRALTAGDEVAVGCRIEVEQLMGEVVTVVTVIV